MGQGAEVVEAFYKAFQHPHYESLVASFLDSGVVWHVAGDNPLAGTFRGVDEVQVAMRRYGEVSGGSLRLDTQSILEGGGHVVAIHEATAERGALKYRAHEIDIFHVEDDRIVSIWSFSEDQAATDKYWS